ncbi:Bug family tripartite tricarboxylate transporter substrate binding protein [Polaromonas sp.]|uniref:Bug family tripartite tricarboxylate transporter substrate binding protein n=1 Tax=Polaromonas sp. TaxID=1869339 RepID=UPI003BAC36AC
MTSCPTISRRSLLQLSAAGAAAAAGLPAAHAQHAGSALDLSKIVLGQPAGSLVDIFARRVADSIQPVYSRNVIVDSRVGAGGQIAISTVKAAPADGTNILLTPSPMMGIYPHTYTKLAYDPVTDFIPVSLGAVFDLAFAIGPLVPASVKTLPQFFEWCKANKGAANFGSPAAGSSPHFMGSMAAQAAGVELTHIPFRGTVPAISDMVGGQIAAVSTPLGDLMPFVDAGKCRLLATTGEKRSRFSPTVPTFAEQGYKNIVLNDWFAFFVAARTPAAHVQRLSNALRTSLTSPIVVKAMAERGLEARWSTSAELAARLKGDLARWKPIVKSLNFTATS